MTSDLTTTIDADISPRGLDLPGVRTLRLAVATTLSVAISYGLAWPLSYITPVFVWAFLKAPTSGLTLPGGLGTIEAMIFGCTLGLVLSLTLLKYPVVFTLVMALLLFLIYYANAGGASPVMVMFTTIGVTVIPMIALSSQEMALIIALALIQNCAVAVGVSWISQAVFREPPHLTGETTAGAATQEIPPRTKIRDAGLSMVVVCPAVVFFFMFNLKDEVLIMVFIAILAQQASSTIGRKISLTMIVGNTLGGVAAIVFYFVAVPNFGFLLLLTLFSGLLFARINFSERKSAPLFAMGFSTLLILIGGSTASDADTAGVKFLIRVGQIILAGLYISIAFRMVESFQERRGRTHAR